MIVFGQYSWSADLEYYNTSAILSVMKEVSTMLWALKWLVV